MVLMGFLWIALKMWFVHNILPFIYVVAVRQA
jgi:hypothetical protein